MEFNKSILTQRRKASKVAREVDHNQQITLHCMRCNTVLGDSHGICGEIKCLDSILCLSVTDDVVVSDKMESGHEGEMAYCIYSSLKCRSCRCAVGKVIHSATSHLAMARSLFLLNKANISCYILNRSSLVKASTLTFVVKPLSESMDELKQQFEAQLDLMSCTQSRMVDSRVTSTTVD